ncbi:MAG: hypothetical protein AB7J28_06655 [Hyphomonadaceae bacterium]
MSDSPQERTPLETGLAAIERLEADIVRKAAATVQAGDPIFHAHFFLIGIVKRTLAQASGFRSLIRQKNFQCAAAILRMQLDSAMRVNALRLVSDPSDFCRMWFNGTPINKLKSADGHKLTDYFLRTKLSEEYDWIDAVYTDASNFVHFSARHFFTALTETNKDEMFIQLAITAEDPPRPDKDYFEVVDAFFNATRVTGVLVLGALHSLVPQKQADV